MALPSHKTKLVCTIGPASDSQVVLEQMIMAGMNVARINFSHGDFSSHKKVIETIRGGSSFHGTPDRYHGGPAGAQDPYRETGFRTH